MSMERTPPAKVKSIQTKIDCSRATQINAEDTEVQVPSTPAMQDPKRRQRNLSSPELFRHSPTDELHGNPNIGPAITSYVKLMIAKHSNSS